MPRKNCQRPYAIGNDIMQKVTEERNPKCETINGRHPLRVTAISMR